jgi:hypothetical protein
MSIIPSILIAIEKSIAEKGVVLKHSTMQLIRDSIIHTADTIVIENISFGKKCATAIVESIIK